MNHTHTHLSSTPITSPKNEAIPERNVQLDVVKYYYQTILKYPYIYSGLQFGCHYVLYRDHPQFVHSTYAIYVIYPTSTGPAYTHTNIPWYTIQTLVRMMADLHKTLILVHIEEFLTDTKGLDNPGIDGTAQSLRSEYSSSTSATTSIAGTGGTNIEQRQSTKSKIIHYPCNGKYYTISELTITTEHAPFRQQQQNSISKVT
jgi:tRNA intron endonuclease, catalytic C-terminal domain